MSASTAPHAPWRERRPHADVIELWLDRPIDDLIRHLLDRYHADVRAFLPRLVLTAKALAMEEPARFQTLSAHLSLMLESLELHLGKEEQVLFPMILDGRGSMARGPISAVFREHEDNENELMVLRELTGGYLPPADAGPEVHALFSDLEILDRETCSHLALENDVLFRRVLIG